MRPGVDHPHEIVVRDAWEVLKVEGDPLESMDVEYRPRSEVEKRVVLGVFDFVGVSKREFEESIFAIFGDDLDTLLKVVSKMRG